jgi:hypothetical protein
MAFLSFETSETADPPAQRHFPDDLNTPNTPTETSNPTILRFNKERTILYVLTEQQVLKEGGGNKNTVDIEKSFEHNKK